MGNSHTLTHPSLAELIDCLTVDQIKEVLDINNSASYGSKISRIKQDLDLIFTKNRMELDASFIRLIIALAQINLHIWRTKDIMQTKPDRFKECMKLAHQLNGLRNQIKNKILDKAGLCDQPMAKSNVETEDLKGWFMSILKSPEKSRPTQEMPDTRHYEFPLADLIDALTINQIKEVFFSGEKRETCIQAINQLSHDVDLLVKEREIKPTGHLVRLIVFLAQANLHIWYNKDRMQNDQERYSDLLEFAQEMNGLRNHVRNLLIKKFNGLEPCNQRTTFLDYNNKRWYSNIIEELNESDNDLTTLTLTLDNFALLLGTTIEDIPFDCCENIKKEDFRYRKPDSTERDYILLNILKRINSGDMWVSGSDKKYIWEKGWTENAQEYKKKRDVSALMPKFLQSRKILRLNREYIQPLDHKFEFNVIDVYRRWAFQKYFKDVKAIYEFGCGSCQHFPVLAELFLEKEFHGLDWTVASTKIIETLVKDKGWNITGHVFDLYSPDDSIALDKTCGVFTVGTMEQLGQNFEPFLQFLLRKRPAVVMHIESIRELYDDKYLTDYLAIQYDKKRNYLEGYLNRLRKLELEGKIHIINTQRILFGSMYHDSYSLLVWKPK